MCRVIHGGVGCRSSVLTLVFRFAIAVVACLALVGCAAQMEALNISKTARKSTEKAKACLLPIENKPEYARIYENVAIARSSDNFQTTPSPAQLAATERVSDDDIAIMLNWYAENSELHDSIYGNNFCCGS